MANDLSNILETAVETFYTRLGASISNYTNVADVIGLDAATIQRADIYGITAFGSQVASPTAEDVKTGKNVVNSAAYEKLVSVTKKNLRDNPELSQSIAGTMADAAAWTIANLFWTTFAALDTTAHPENGGNYTEAGAGTVYFADVFATPVAQGNLATTALSSSSLGTARSTMRGYKNKTGLPLGLDMTPANLRLVVPPALETTARDLVGRPGELYDGSGLQSGSFQGMQVVVMPTAGDDNDWWLVHRPSSPVKIWVRKQPSIRITEAEATGHFHFYGELEAATVLEPFEGGVVMNKVA